MRGNVEVNNPSSVVTENDEDVQNAKGHARNGEKVADGDVRNVIVQKRPPGLRRRFPSAEHVLGHGPFGDLVAQQRQFRYDPRCAPSRIFPGYASSRNMRRIRSRISRSMGGRPGLPGFDFHLQYTLNPIRCHLMTVSGCTMANVERQFDQSLGQPHPEDPIAWMQLRTSDGFSADRQLLSQGQVLDGQGNEHRPEKQRTCFQHAHFRALVDRGNRRF